MPIARTAKNHFDEDIQRARALLNHAFDGSLNVPTLQEDISRSSWMMAVGAVDAFFCDAYADAIARCLQAKNIEPSVSIPDRLRDLKIPVSAVIHGTQTGNWGWRMAARDLIEKESVLDLQTVKKHFNQFFADDAKLFGERSFDGWILHNDWKHRLFGITKTEYRALTGAARNTARKSAKLKFEKRFQNIFQRRHDCIHNCDRVKVSLNRRHVNNQNYVGSILEDICFLVERFTEELQIQFPAYIQGLGYSNATRARVTQ